VNRAPALMAPLCPRCRDPMRLSRKKFWVRQGLPVYLCGRCGYLEVGEDNDGLQTES
jgi:Zn ribbon nucleic-acid-binding protein